VLFAHRFVLQYVENLILSVGGFFCRGLHG
jgi:hypothetical protein